jgi:hypothetical protein
MKLNSTSHWSLICGLLSIALTQTAAQAQGPLLPQPESMTVDRSLSQADAAQMIQAARLFYAFWDTGNAEYASAVVDNDFRDNTLPEGRPQGPKGLLLRFADFSKCRARPSLRSKTCWLAEIKSPRGFSSPVLTKVSSWATLRPARL